MSGIVNRVEASGIITLDLEELIPDRTRSYIDIKDQLFKGLILREKDFRSWVKPVNRQETAPKLKFVPWPRCTRSSKTLH